MHNMIFSLHDPTTFPSSSNHTTARQRTVDGIWGTANLTPIKAGYLETTDFPGDHYPLWFDISYSDALGHTPSKLTRPSIRRLQLNNKRSTHNYQTKYKKLCIEHNLFQRMFMLEAQTLKKLGSPLTPAQATEANSIDNLKTRSMLTAANCCRHIRAGQVDYSDKTSNAGQALRFWRAAASRRAGYLKMHPMKWAQLKQDAGITISTRPLSLEDLWMKVKAARKKYLEHKKNHRQCRLDYLKEKFPEKDRLRIIRIEAQRRQGLVVRSINGKLKTGAVSAVIIDSTGKRCTGCL